MYQYVIYENPTDYPGKYVVRRWLIGRGTVTPDAEPLAVLDALSDARMFVPDGLYMMPRELEDDPAVLEVWI